MDDLTGALLGILSAILAIWILLLSIKWAGAVLGMVFGVEL